MHLHWHSRANPVQCRLWRLEELLLQIRIWRLKTSGMEVQRLDALPKSCTVPLAHDARPLVNFDYFWNTFSTHYAFFPAHGVDWNAVRRQLRPKVVALPEDGDVFHPFRHGRNVERQPYEHQ